MIWFTSDTHFGHANVLAFCGRPWGTVGEMGDALVDAINERVAPEDTLYHLGDFSFRMTVDAARGLHGRIRCRDVRRVPGNHDKGWSQPAVAGTFAVEPPIATLRLPGGRTDRASTLMQLFPHSSYSQQLDEFIVSGSRLHPELDQSKA